VKKGHVIFLSFALILLLAGPMTASCAEHYYMPGTGIIPGMVSNLAGQYFIVLGTIRTSPADRSRIRVGDKLVSINGTSVDRLSSTERIFEELNPPEGSQVQVRVERLAEIVGDEGEFFDFTFTSAPIRITPHAIPDMGLPDTRIKSPTSTHRYGTRLRTDGPFRQGDFFLVFDGNYCVGTARIWAEGKTFGASIGNLPGSHGSFDPEGMKMVFFRPVNQSTHVTNSARDWPIRLPEPKLHPLFVKYDARKDLDRLTGEVMSHFKEKNSILLKVVADIHSSPMSGAPPPGGGMYVQQTVYYDIVTVRYDSKTDEIPRGAKGSIKRGDYVGIFYPKGDKKNEIQAELVHLLKAK
jgi:hypothetical protein